MVVTWLKKNLFRSAADSVVTVVVGSLTIWAAYRFLRFVFVTGRWDVVRANLGLFTTGSWPTDQLWRLTAVLVALAVIWGAGAGFTSTRMSVDVPPETGTTRLRSLATRAWPAVLTVALLLALTATPGPTLLTVGVIIGAVAGWVVGSRIEVARGGLMTGAFILLTLAAVWFLHTGVDWNEWGGVLLNFLLAGISIALCFPVGVMMALGRRSEFPIVRGIATVYIELFRAVPLIALLLMANVALGFFIPRDLAPGKIVRAIVILVLFTSAYVAEIVRGGLQSVPKGQIEAGRANGLSPIAITNKIVLPQAIRNVIPALVGQFISLFKDTTLAGAALGVTDLLVAAEASTAQPAFRGQGLIAETLVFVALVFWAGSFTMSMESQRLEKRLGVGDR